MLWALELDVISSVICPVAGFAISGDEPLGSATRGCN